MPALTFGEIWSMSPAKLLLILVQVIFISRQIYPLSLTRAARNVAALDLILMAMQETAYRILVRTSFYKIKGNSINL